ncbi:MAG: hypothetical protein LBT97_10170 [Planctomycetota bacterium]|jgi:hypothetical protein|nr:hypothetical protein [Planctomycetota bacterium]
MIVPGNTFFLDSGAAKHLFFVVLGPVVFPGYSRPPHFVLVNATTFHKGSWNDPACVLDAGEHPFIRHKSYIAYRHARIDPQENVERFARQKLDDCSPVLLARIASGLAVSRFTPRFIKEALRTAESHTASPPVSGA